MSVRRNEIIARVAERVEPRRPLDARDVERAERLLGADLPADLRDLYLACGNGGFGPGVRALLEEDDEQAIGELPGQGAPGTEVSQWSDRWGHWEDWSIVRVTRVFRAWEADSEEVEPPGLLRFFSWGCAIQSCVDTLDTSCRVVRFDPNLGPPDEDQPEETTIRSSRYGEFTPLYAPPLVSPWNRNCYLLESRSLVEWFDVWLEGHTMVDLQRMEPQRRRWRG